MRGRDERGDGLFSYVDLEARVPADHPLRAIRALVDEALAALSGDFALLYSKTGRPSIAPEKLLRAPLLQAFYTIRSERQLMEQLDYNLLFRWFVGLSMDAPVAKRIPCAWGMSAPWRTLPRGMTSSSRPPTAHQSRRVSSSSLSGVEQRIVGRGGQDGVAADRDARDGRGGHRFHAQQPAQERGEHGREVLAPARVHRVHGRGRWGRHVGDREGGVRMGHGTAPWRGMETPRHGRRDRGGAPKETSPGRSSV